MHAFLLERPVQAMDLAGDARWAPPADAATVHGVGAALAALLELAAEAQRGSGLSRRLQDLVQGQAVVEQAKGALMASKGMEEKTLADRQDRS